MSEREPDIEFTCILSEVGIESFFLGAPTGAMRFAIGPGVGGGEGICGPHLFELPIVRTGLAVDDAGHQILFGAVGAEGRATLSHPWPSNRLRFKAWFEEKT